jgi:hypothetical protein
MQQRLCTSPDSGFNQFVSIYLCIYYALLNDSVNSSVSLFVPWPDKAPHIPLTATELVLGTSAKVPLGGGGGNPGLDEQQETPEAPAVYMWTKCHTVHRSHKHLCLYLKVHHTQYDETVNLRKN